MPIRSFLFSSAAAVCLVCGHSNARAEQHAHAQAHDESAPPEEDDAGGCVVLGVASLPEFEGAAVSQLVPFAVADFQVFGAGVEIRGLQGTIDLLGKGSMWRAGPAFSVSTPRDANTPELAALGEVGFAFEAGAFIGFETPYGGLNEGALSGQVAFRHDLLDAHGGFLVTPEIEYFFAVARFFRIGASLNASFADANYMETYFGVPEREGEAAGLSAFDAEAGFKDVGAELYSILSFNEQWGIFTRGAYNRILGNAANSPIVTELGDKNQVFFGAGAFYRF